MKDTIINLPDDRIFYIKLSDMEPGSLLKFIESEEYISSVKSMIKNHFAGVRLKSSKHWHIYQAGGWVYSPRKRYAIGGGKFIKFQFKIKDTGVFIEQHIYGDNKIIPIQTIIQQIGIK